MKQTQFTPRQMAGGCHIGLVAFVSEMPPAAGGNDRRRRWCVRNIRPATACPTAGGRAGGPLGTVESVGGITGRRSGVRWLGHSPSLGVASTPAGDNGAVRAAAACGAEAMRTLVVDTALTGRYNYRELPDDPCQPHMLRLGWVETDNDQITGSGCWIVKPRPDWVLEPDTVVGFNFDHQQKVLQRSAAECGLAWQHLFNSHRPYCAMRNATDIVRKERMAPGGGFAWPKFGEAYWFFANEELPSLDMDPKERGIALARAVWAIYQGILEHSKPLAKLPRQ